MTMELEGNLSLERSHTRRWVPFVAVIVPVGAIVLLAAWFIRVYVAPATVLIPNPPMTVAEPVEPPRSSVRAQTEAAERARRGPVECRGCEQQPHRHRRREPDSQRAAQ